MKNLSFQYLLKPVGEMCNNACTYCYYKQNRIRGAIKFKKMPLWLAKKIIKDIAEVEEKNGGESAEIIWHGGEPLLAGIDFYKNVFNFQQRFLIPFKNAFQTNGELITQEWCDFFKEHKCNIGFSMDGPPEIHDQQRKSKSGSGTSSKVLNGIELCRKNGVTFGGVLCVVTNLSSRHPKAILNYFYSKGIKTFDFLPAYNDEDVGTAIPSLSLSPHKFSSFMKIAFDWYLEKNDPEVDIRTISDIMSRLLGGRVTLCSMQGTVCGRFLTIYQNGKVRFCDDYNGGKFEDIGDVKKETIYQIITNNKFKSLRKSTNRRFKKCMNCEVVAICNGGCPRHWNKEGNYYCTYYKDFYYYCYEKISKVLYDAAS